MLLKSSVVAPLLQRKSKGGAGPDTLRLMAAVLAPKQATCVLVVLIMIELGG